jgi:hypothetical protein
MLLHSSVPVDEARQKSNEKHKQGVKDIFKALVYQLQGSRLCYVIGALSLVTPGPRAFKYHR